MNKRLFDWRGQMLPDLDLQSNINHSPHVVIIGAGASKAAFPQGDANGKLVPLMMELVDYIGLRPLLLSDGIQTDGTDFEILYDRLATSGKYKTLVTEIENRVYDYFSQLKLPDSVTLYDKLVLGLREKDLIASFNWDPFLAQAWERNSRSVKLPKIVFLHGNVSIGICRKHRTKNFVGSQCSTCGNEMEPTPLLYPVSMKNYNSDPFISGEWNTLQLFLQQAYLLTIFGYAAPITDIEARDLLLNAWRENRSFELADVEIIDIKPPHELSSTWNQFFCREHYGFCRDFNNSDICMHPRRSCEAFAMATLQNDPWQENPFPKLSNLESLQRWSRILWEEENLGKLSGKMTDEI